MEGSRSSNESCGHHVHNKPLVGYSESYCRVAFTVVENLGLRREKRHCLMVPGEGVGKIGLGQYQKVINRGFVDALLYQTTVPAQLSSA